MLILFMMISTNFKHSLIHQSISIKKIILKNAIYIYIYIYK